MLFGRYSVRTFNTRSTPQSDASKFSVLVIIHRQYISRLGPCNCQSIGNRKSFDFRETASCVTLTYVLWYAKLKGDPLTATLAIYIKIVILKLPNNSQVLSKRNYNYKF